MLTRDQAEIIATFLEQFPCSWFEALGNVRRARFSDEEILGAINEVHRTADRPEMEGLG